jgi:polyferredoxin
MDPFPGYPPGAAPTTSTAHGMLHTICAYTIIISLVLSCFTLASRFWSGAHWRGWAVYSSITGVLMLVLWEVFVQYPTSPVAGLVERLSAGSHDLWMCAALVMLFFQHRRQRILL